MNNTKEIKDAFDKLLSTQGAKTRSSGTQISVRCPFCGDSQNINESHLYIRTTAPFIYNCYKCPSSGIVGKHLLRNLFGEPDYDLENTFAKYNKFKGRGNDQRMFGEDDIVYRINNSEILYDPDKYAKAISYLQGRLNSKINKSFIIKNKIILNVDDFISHNKLEDIVEIPKKRLNMTKRAYIKTFDHCIGFLSSSMKGINCRVYEGNYSRRYYTLPFIKSKSRFGTIHTFIPKVELDLTIDNPRIVLAEGPFDILNIKDMYYKESINTISVGVGSKSSYLNTLKYIVNISAFIDADIEIFCDPETLPDDYQNIVDYWGSNITLYYNEDGDDFGNIETIGDIKKYVIKPKPKKSKH